MALNSMEEPLLLPCTDAECECGWARHNRAQLSAQQENGKRERKRERRGAEKKASGGENHEKSRTREQRGVGDAGHGRRGLDGKGEVRDSMVVKKKQT